MRATAQATRAEREPEGASPREAPVADVTVTAAAPQTLAVVSSGARVELRGARGEEVLEVRDASGALLFEHRAAEGRSVVHVPAGSLELRVDAGDLDLVAAGRVRVRGGAGVSVESEAGVTLRAPAPAADASDPAREGAPVRLEPRVDVRPQGVLAQGPRVDARAAQSSLATDEARLVVKKLVTAVERAQHAVGVLETRAGRIVERARATYREVRDLAQTRAGRLRWVADEALHAHAKRVNLKADEDVNVQGEKIYLG